MTFQFRPAKRENVSLLIGLAGGKPFCVIDTEAGRAKHYADEFRFDHGELLPPFRPQSYLDAITAADAAGYPVIVVDSFSHEHAGEGGLLEWHDEELQRLGGREAQNFTAWQAPKAAHRQMVQRLLQVRAHLVLCFRAEEKIEIVKDPKTGKTVVQPKRSVLPGLEGWVPIAEKNMPYELTLFFLLHNDAPGVPRVIKLPAP